MYEDTPEDVAAERLIAGCFPGALGRPVLGRSSSLARQTGESLRAFMARHYAAPRSSPRSRAASRMRTCGSSPGAFPPCPRQSPKSLKDRPTVPASRSGARPRSRTSSSSASPGLRRQVPSVSPSSCSPASWAATPPRAFSRACGKSTGFATPSTPSRRALRTRASSPSPPRRTGTPRRAPSASSWTSCAASWTGA